MATSVNVERVLLTDNVDVSCKEALEAAGIGVEVRNKMTKDELLSLAPEFDALVVRSATKVREDVLRAGAKGKLKLIGRAGTGVDNVDIDTATQLGILVMNAPGGNTLSAAEHTCGLIMALARNTAGADASMKSGEWDRKKFMGIEVYGKTLAILGVGRIGKEVALRMQSFGMKTLGYDPIIPAHVTKEFGVDQMSPEELYPIADFITVHTPLLPSTKGMINDDVFGRCKKGVQIINAARGGIVDEDALLRALQSGQCAGAGLDVYAVEPPTNTGLIQHPHVIACPHIGASTVEGQRRCGGDIGHQIVNLTQKKGLVGAINCSALEAAYQPALKPLLNLAIALGKLASVSEGTAFSVSVPEAHKGRNSQSLAVGVLTGILLPSNSSVNLINASGLAKAKGISVEVKGAPSPGCDVTVAVNGAVFSGCAVGGEAIVIKEVFGKRVGVLLAKFGLIFAGDKGVSVDSVMKVVGAGGSAVVSAGGDGHVVGLVQGESEFSSQVVEGVSKVGGVRKVALLRFAV